MLRIEGISKTFRGRPALHPLSLEIREGEIFGLLGHNGAGKSTTFGITLGQLHPDAGQVYVREFSVQRQRAQALSSVGAIFETPGFYDYLSGWQNLRALVSYSAIPDDRRMREVVALVGLTERIHDRVRVYSHGMRQRLALAQALLPDPRLIILDEPSEGLDPEGIQELRHLILRLRDEMGLTVLLSSHLLPEVEQLCDRVAILNRGRLVFSGSWRETSQGGNRVRMEIDDWNRARPCLEKFHAEIDGENILRIPLEIDLADITAALVEAGVRVREIARMKPTLEDFYLDHSGS